MYGDDGRLVYSFERPFLPEMAKVLIERDDSGLQALPVKIQDVAPAQESSADSRIIPFLNLARAFVSATFGATPEDFPDFSCGLRVRRVMGAVQESIQSGGSVSV